MSFDIKEYGDGIRAFNMTTMNYNLSQQVTVEKNCIGFMFTNVGDVAAKVNGMVIFPGTAGSILGDSRSIAAHAGDIFQGKIELAFIQPTVGIAPNVEIVQLFYAESYTQINY